MRETPARFDISPVLRFLRCRSPQAWSDQAATDPDALLLDHAALELKAAQQAQRLISKYGAAAGARRPDLSDAFRSRLSKQMSRLAREELRHFEQVIAVIERRGGRFRAVSPSRYAASLHALARSTEPSAMLDSLLIGAIIEARSCERFDALLGPLGDSAPDIQAFYSTLLKCEARHFQDYLALAEGSGAAAMDERLDVLLEADARLIAAPDTELRFLSGPMPAPGSGQFPDPADFQRRNRADYDLSQR